LAQREAEAAERRERETAAALRKAGVPLRWLQRGPYGPHPQADAAADRIAGRLGTGALVALVGNRGNGKTTIGCRLLREAALRGRSVRYTTAMEVFFDLRATYRDGARENERDVVTRLAGYDLLVVDELHERAESAWETRTLVHLIDRRYRDMRDTVLVANLTPEALADSLGPSFADRLRETGWVETCDWPSFRGAGERRAS